MKTYTIKPLEWEDVCRGFWVSGDYHIYHFEDGTYRLWNADSKKIVENCRSLAVAKAAAEAHWQARMEQGLEWTGLHAEDHIST